MNEKQIISELRKIRIERNLRQKAIGRAVGRHDSDISAYERGISYPLAGVLDRWAEFLGYEIILRPKNELEPRARSPDQPCHRISNLQEKQTNATTHRN